MFLDLSSDVGRNGPEWSSGLGRQHSHRWHSFAIQVQVSIHTIRSAKCCISYFGNSSGNKSAMIETLVPTLSSLGELSEKLNMEEQFSVELVEKPEHEGTVRLPVRAC